MLTDLRLRLRSLFKRDLVERELDDELTFHLEQLTASFEREGMTHAEAARRARLALGGFDQIKEEHRDARGVHPFADVGADLRYALRQMRRAPAFAALAMLCLGLGIGVNVAIFSVVNAVILRPLPGADAERLVKITRADQPVMSYAGYQRFRDETRVLSGVTVSFPMESDIDLNGESEFVVAEMIPATYAEVMGVTLTLGRWPADETEMAAVISHAVWDRRFNRDPQVLGRLIRSESQTYTIVGVAPREFGGVFAPMRTDIWVPVRTRPRLAAMIDERQTTRMMLVFGRLPDGATSAETATALNIIDARPEADSAPPSSPRLPLVVDRVRGVASGGPEIPRMATLLGGVVGLVLLIACVNVGNLLLVRGTLRQREFAVRRALGATRVRLLRQQLLESLVLSIGGGLCGVVLALWTNRLLEMSFPTVVSAYAVQIALGLDWRGVAFATLVSLFTTVLCGWLPAWRTSRATGLVGFKQEIGSAAPRRRPLGLVAQVVMSLVLLFVAGSFLQALVRMQTFDPGFAVAGRLYAYTYMPVPPATGERPRDFYARALDRVRALPGVANVTLANPLPLMPAGSACASSAAGVEARTTTAYVGVDYFETMDIGLLAGRGFTANDLTAPVLPIVVNETLARRLWPDAVAIGQPLRVGCDPAESAIVVGVARDTAVRALTEAPPPHVYRPFAGGVGITTLMVRTDPDPATMVEPVRRALLALGEGVRVYKVEPLAVHVEQSYAAFRWMASVLTGFGVLALILSAVGLYGVISYRVALRTQEIGVRMAIGATRRDIFREIVRYGLVIALTGVAIGEVLTAALTGVAASLVDRIGPTSWSTHVAVAAIWIVVAVIACYLPAARAARVDPIVALRHE